VGAKIAIFSGESHKNILNKKAIRGLPTTLIFADKIPIFPRPPAI
jgi:hypothetical protein